MRMSVYYKKHLLEVIDLYNLDEFTGQQLVGRLQSHHRIADDLFLLHCDTLLNNEFLDSRHQNKDACWFSRTSPGIWTIRSVHITDSPTSVVRL